MTQSPWQQDSIIDHSQRLIKSFQHWTKRSLLADLGSLQEQAKALFEAPFVIVSHGTESDPIFNYGNAQALALWQLDWQTFTQMPSRQSVEPIAQAERDLLLNEANTRGYITNYQGVRIASTGQRFSIANVILWNVLDEYNQLHGQAATFSHWNFIQ